jgi:hypothetical protein
LFFFCFVYSEEINKRLKSKAEESGIKSEEEGEIDDHDDDSDNEKVNKNSIRKSNVFDNDIYAEDDEDDYRISTNRRKQINASKQKDSEHNKSLQLLVEGRKKKQGNGSFKLKDQFLNYFILRRKKQKISAKI